MRLVVLLAAAVTIAGAALVHQPVFGWGAEDDLDALSPVEMLLQGQDDFFRSLESGDPDAPLNDRHARIREAKLAKEESLASPQSLRQAAATSERRFDIHVEVAHTNEFYDPVVENNDWLAGCGGPAGSRVYVELQVNGATTLRDLHANVLAPAMGYRRRYHGYMFTDTTDGAQFGISGPDHPAWITVMQPVDMAHMKLRGYEVIDDRSVTLSQLLAEPGDSVFYLSDLGDMLNHTVTLLRTTLVPGLRSDAKATLLQGHGPESYHENGDITWPKEDQQGSAGFCKLRAKEWRASLRKKKEQKKKKKKKKKRSEPLRLDGLEYYDDLEDLEDRINERLADAARRPPSAMDDAHVRVEHGGDL